MKFKKGDKVYKNKVKYIVDFEFGGWVALKGQKYSVRVDELKPVVRLN